ncbi:single-stranded DNA-binding protein [Devosia lacusdianchii]|uniref:single-stranded DNA-binding protein n=1 Tax=Devosia lacusdianchii TaxID=2917991 RepID=UPI001F065795|nr:single-stranded DNA-binding protein [Devosia sp. JXJ CY 41]
MQIAHVAGNVGKDAVIKTLQNGDKVLSFSVAVDNGKDKDATWYDCSLFGKRGESLERYITKGSKVTAMGRLSVRVHEGKAYLSINVSEITLQGSSQSRGDDRGESRPSGGASQSQSGGYQPSDDDIPF